MTQPIEIVVSFDSTGSMYGCLSEVRRRVSETAERLFKEIPGLKIGIIAHGDYCDERTTYVTKHLQLTDDVNAVTHFVNGVERTGGGDAPECYELVLHEAHQVVKWTPDSRRVLVMIGDEVPHPVAHNPKRLAWDAEAKKLRDIGVVVHGVQALNNRHAESFYGGIANITGGVHLRLAQFTEATQLLFAVAYQQSGEEALQNYEQELVTNKQMTRSLSAIFDKLMKRDPNTGTYGAVDARASDPSRFQKIAVPSDCSIKDFTLANDLIFKVGRGFYEFTKKETIQASKEVIILDRTTGDMFEGNAARDVLGLPYGSPIRMDPRTAGFDTTKYTVFVQSTSANRKLIGGTDFLYDTHH